MLLWSAGVRKIVINLNKLRHITQLLSANPKYTVCVRFSFGRMHGDVSLYILSPLDRAMNQVDLLGVCAERFYNDLVLFHLE